jgi:integrase
MASIIRVNDKWRAQIRRRGMPIKTASFPTKALATQWARAIEAEIDAGRILAVTQKSSITIGQLVRRYVDEIGDVKPFGRNKDDVLKRIWKFLDTENAADLTAERIVEYILEDRGISGVTASIDLTYLKGVLKIARALWREPVSPAVVDDAREILRYMGQLERSNMRDRRPTTEEIEGIKNWCRRSDSLTPDIIDFILASCFRPPSEIVRLRWQDIDHADRTIVIHDRKDPRRKIGNHQIVPLLNGSYDIVMRQPQRAPEIFPANGDTWSNLFPRACRDLGIKDLTLYDLRHLAITRLVESRKYSIPEMMLVTGHKDPRQLMRYTHIQARDLHR